MPPSLARVPEWQPGGNCPADVLPRSNGATLVGGEDSIGLYRPGDWNNGDEEARGLEWHDLGTEDDE